MIYHFGLRCDFCGVVHEITVDSETMIELKLDTSSGILIPRLEEGAGNGEQNTPAVEGEVSEAPSADSNYG